MTEKKHEKRRVRGEMRRTGANYTTAQDNLKRRGRAAKLLASEFGSRVVPQEELAKQLAEPDVLERVEASFADLVAQAMQDALEEDDAEVGQEPPPRLDEARTFLKSLDRKLASLSMGSPASYGLGAALADGFAMIERTGQTVIAFAYNEVTRTEMLRSDLPLEVHADRDVLWGASAFVRADLSEGEFLLLGDALTTVHVEVGPHVEKHFFREANSPP